ncbi:MAG: zinc-dependent alcohol dehydrogenase [Armatimonadota bacterium]|jgi:L-iditol 2-dehydrogenase
MNSDRAAGKEMRAMVLTGKGRLNLQEVERPEIHPEGVLARVEAVGICNATDLRVVEADDPTAVWPNRPWPVILGHEVCGVVEEVGAEVQGWQPGDRIAGWCPPCGGFAEFCQFYPNYMAAVRVPPDMPAEEAALLELSIGTTRYFMPEGVIGRIRSARSALVLGLGPSGQLYVRECGLLGIPQVLASDRHESRRRLAHEMGAAEVFEGGKEPFRILRDRGQTVDVVIDTTGRDLVDDILQVLAPGGVIIPFGVGVDWESKRSLLDERGITLANAHLEEARRAAPQVLEWVRTGKLPVFKLITRTGRLEDIPDALQSLRERRDIKVIIRPC